MTTYKELAERLEETMHDDAGFHLAVDEAIEILRSLDAQEPFGWLVDDLFFYKVQQLDLDRKPLDNQVPLYAAPVAAQPTELEALRQQKDGAYFERNQVVAALAKCFPSGVAKTSIEGWSEDWHGCVYIDLPTGQVSWHFHDSQAYLFKDLPPYAGAWDGHDTPEKYRRVNALAAQASKPLSDAEIFDLAEPFGAFEFGDAQGDKRLDFARAAITAFCLKNGIKDAGMNWQPISTAPKDGRKIILFYKNRNGFDRHVFACWLTQEEVEERDTDGVGLEAGWYEQIDNWPDYTDVSIYEGEPRYWLPLDALPPPPKD